MRTLHPLQLLSMSFLLCLGCETVTTEDRSLSMPEAQQSSYRDSELEKLEELADKYPKRADYHYQIAGIHFQQEDYEESAGSLQQAIYLAPDQSQYPYHLGRVYLRMGDVARAKEQFQRSLELTRSERYSGPRAALAYTLALLKDTEGAIREFERCVEIEPENSEFYYFLGCLHDMRGESSEAVRFFREYLERGGRTYRKKTVFILESLGVIVEDSLREPPEPTSGDAPEKSVLPPPPVEWPSTDPARAGSLRPLD